ncbi:probable ubiquitin carboxyl-terminal hydrolase MINDY-4 isoform X2 [Halichondria panicea]|uniref:probable ubiquitin carboxyl-terminal hydrolase MINDY-4 isoform X2 n=1 Tax=Halichondria panicea TaxID=6063 RepID=UPI00312B2F7B
MLATRHLRIDIPKMLNDLPPLPNNPSLLHTHISLVPAPALMREERGSGVSTRGDLVEGRGRKESCGWIMIEHTFMDRITMDSFLRSRLPSLQDGSSSGCIQFLLSVLLTKGVASIQSEMDESNGHLIGAHGYCTQELVNLLLTGVAVSNVFDGEVDMGSKGKEKLVLRGLNKQSEIGLLSLFEHYQSCMVGSNYKDPVYPIWVICSESHFSVLFSHQRWLLENPRLQRRFDLHYYDGLANQDEAIRLTIDNAEGRGSLVEDALTPPLELCIRTKWRSVTVSWNGSEPIL